MVELVSAATVRLLPEHRWPAVAARLAGLRRDGNSRRFLAFSRVVEAVLGGPIAEDDALAWWHTTRAMKYRRSLSVAADLRRSGWAPLMTVEGTAHVEEALTGGRGVILWCDAFGLEAAVSMKALASVGLSLATVSFDMHGPARSEWGNRIVNRRWRSQQARYVTERIVFSKASPLVAMRRLRNVLADNRIVRIANNAVLGKTHSVALGGARLPVATTPLQLALQGIPLLPIAVIETEPMRSFDVRIGKPFVPNVDLPRSEGMDDLARQYADYLLALLREHPEQWINWSKLRLD